MIADSAFNKVLTIIVRSLRPANRNYYITSLVNLFKDKLYFYVKWNCAKVTKVINNIAVMHTIDHTNRPHINPLN